MSDGNYLWINETDGQVTSVTRYGANDVEQLLEWLAGVSGSEIISEHEEGYWDEDEEV